MSHHSSWGPVAKSLRRSALESLPRGTRSPYSILLQIGFTTPLVAQSAIEFTTQTFQPLGVVSVALSVTLRYPVVNWYLSLRSPDFPLQARRLGAMACLPEKRGIILHVSGSSSTPFCSDGCSFNFFALLPVVDA